MIADVKGRLSLKDIAEMANGYILSSIDCDAITVKTLAPLHNGSEWEYFSKKFQRICWIHKDAFVFSTPNGNVTWTE